VDLDRRDLRIVPDGEAPRWLLNIFRANLIAQVGIVVTGGLVRLTGSGLGCPTWPECVDGSLVPTARQEESWHKLVEFGNRTLTFLLVALAIAALAGALVWARRQKSSGAVPRRSIVALAAVPLVGTFAQAVLGGITVLTGLHPAVVAAHFLLSVAIIGFGTVLVDRAQDTADRPVTQMVRVELRRLADVLLVLAALIIIMGTVVTGSGPNSGDADVSHRFGLDQRIAAWIHADTVFLFVGLLAGLVLALHLVAAPRRAVRRTWILVAVTVANGVVGYLQLFTGLPWLAVAVHMLLACLIWVAAIRMRLSLRHRGPLPAPSGAESPGERISADARGVQ
jgi:cytochrome c oxidase assembly protein subunit 15